MMKKIFCILTFSLLFSCVTSKTTTSSIEVKPEEFKTVKEEEDRIIREKISESVILSIDPYYADYAALVLQLIQEKNWDEVSKLTDDFFYENYYVDSPVELVDYCMFMLHTGDKGISTNYSLNQLNNAFYTSSLEEEGKITLEGLYIFPENETEYFKIIIIDNSEGLTITRE